jgi:hypothetical protein
MKYPKNILLKFEIGAIVSGISLLSIIVVAFTGCKNLMIPFYASFIIGWLILIASLNEGEDFLDKKKRNKKKAK